MDKRTAEKIAYAGRTVLVNGAQEHTVPALSVGPHCSQHVADGQREQHPVDGVADGHDPLIARAAASAAVVDRWQHHVFALLLHRVIVDDGRKSVVRSRQRRRDGVVQHASSVDGEHLLQTRTVRAAHPWIKPDPVPVGFAVEPVTQLYEYLGL